MSINNKLIALALGLVVCSAQAGTLERELIINNKSFYDVQSIGKIARDIDFILPMTFKSSTANIVPLTFDLGSWVDFKFPQASFNLVVQCPQGGQDTIMVTIQNSDPAVVQASSFMPQCVRVAQDRKRLTFDNVNAMVQLDIVNK